MAILNPVVWSVQRLRDISHVIGSESPNEYWHGMSAHKSHSVAKIGLHDLRVALQSGIDDFGFMRTDVILLCLIYPVVGLLLAYWASGVGMWPMLFPLASGFALVGPVASIGFYELSRRREKGLPVGWSEVRHIVHSPSFFPIIILSVILMAILGLWLTTAQIIYNITLGPLPPLSLMSFLHDTFTTAAGWAMIVGGIGIGFVFSVIVLALSVVSFPMLLDENVGIDRAVRLSIQTVMDNPGTMMVWGMMIAIGLVLGSLPALLGLIVVLPVLGHATWHLYRRVIKHQ
jgi:uncharacterized membrane protein